MTMQWCHVQTPKVPVIVFYNNPDRAKDLMEELQRKGKATKEGFKVIELSSHHKKNEKREEIKLEEAEETCIENEDNTDKLDKQDRSENFYNNYGIDWHRQYHYVAIK